MWWMVWCLTATSTVTPALTLSVSISSMPFVVIFTVTGITGALIRAAITTTTISSFVSLFTLLCCLSSVRVDCRIFFIFWVSTDCPEVCGALRAVWRESHTTGLRVALRQIDGHEWGVGNDSKTDSELWLKSLQFSFVVFGFSSSRYHLKSLVDLPSVRYSSLSTRPTHPLVHPLQLRLIWSHRVMSFWLQNSNFNTTQRLVCFVNTITHALSGCCVAIESTGCHHWRYQCYLNTKLMAKNWSRYHRYCYILTLFCINIYCN